MLIISIAVCSLTAFERAHAGKEGHGAAGVLSIDDPKAPIELLDLWEAKESGLKVPLLDLDVEDQVFAAIKKLGKINPFLAREVERAYFHILGRIEFTQPGRVLTPNADVDVESLPDDKALVGIAEYHTMELSNEDIVYVSRSYLLRMSLTHEAALLFHEAIYKVLRLSETAFDAKAARKVTGWMFSSSNVVPPSVASYIKTIEVFDCRLKTSLAESSSESLSSNMRMYVNRSGLISVPSIGHKAKKPAKIYIRILPAADRYHLPSRSTAGWDLQLEGMSQEKSQSEGSSLIPKYGRSQTLNSSIVFSESFGEAFDLNSQANYWFSILPVDRGEAKYFCEPAIYQSR